jgi:hypothetical protein
MSEQLDTIKAYFEDGDEGAVTDIEFLESWVTSLRAEINVRLSFRDCTVSDWKVILDEDGVVVDATCYNDVM